MHEHRVLCKGLNMTDRRLPSSEVCEALGISRSALTQWLDKGWITAYEQLSNGAYLFTEEALASAKAEQTARADKPPVCRVTLGCGCTFRVEKFPDLAQPYLCRADDHGLTSIVAAVRLPETVAAS